ncbi:MAG: glycerol-3-phosphate dehydrogenase [Gaiellales bacterium]|nr:glycerol-3-phosphate dehydrogenase [Gaiellales bacterium]
MVDVLVIGAGILGAATAWAAARAGASVALVDQGDIAGATSSASSKLLHGGLRYLAMGDLKLVREAHRERRLSAERLAPHLVRPLEFVVPVGRDAPVPLWKVRAGVWLYGSLARFGDGRSGRIPVAEAAVRAPGLRTDGLAGTVLYHDHQTHDGRLTLAVAQAAAARGAIVTPHVAVVALRITAGRVTGADLVDRLSGAPLAVTACSVVNAAGPWVDAVRRMESATAGTSVRLSKGAHLLLEAEGERRSALTTPLPQGRVSFAIPWEGMLLLGTTDEPFEGDPATVTATDSDQRQILAEASQSLEPWLLDPGRVRSRFAGVRVLPVAGRSTARIRRETVIGRGPAGMVSVAGGKLTTWPAVGERAAGLARAGRSAPAAATPLPGAAAAAEIDAALARAWPGLDADIRAALGRHYGTVALDLLEPARDRPELLERIDPNGPDIWAQVPHARDHEWAATADDVLRRRATVAYRGPVAAAVHARVAELLAER